MLENATSAAECRVLVDMFLARSKLALDVTSSRAPTVPPPPRDSGVSGLEKAVVELFLGDDGLDVQHKLSLDFHREKPGEISLDATDAPRSMSLTSSSVDSR